MPLPKSTTLRSRGCRIADTHAEDPGPGCQSHHRIFNADRFKARSGKTGYFGARELLQTTAGEDGKITAYAQAYFRPDGPDRALVFRAVLAVEDRKEPSRWAP